MKRAALVSALLLLVAAGAEAQTSTPADSSRPAILARRISVHLKDVALRDALDRIALLGGIRLSYSGDNLPLDRRVSVSLDTTAVGDALDEVLRGYPVRAVVAGDEQVVLAPSDMPAQKDSLASSLALLDRVVVTGSVIAASERPLPVALDVVPGREIERRNEGDLSKVLSGAVPGVWMWEQAPTSMLARYGSIRGASSFGVSYPKIYVDGIEVANPLLFTQIAPELIERVEVIRGPQGAALYGSDAISGVVNMVSRHEGTRADGTHSLLRSSAGYTTAFQTGGVPTQEHALTVRGGSNLRSGGFTVGGGTTGDYIPDAYSRDVRTLADAQIIGSNTTLTANARFIAKKAGTPTNPLLPRSTPDADPQSMSNFGLGSTLNIAASDQVTYSVTGGFDGYNLSNLWIDQSPVPAAVDPRLRANGSAVRGSLRASAVGRFGSPERFGATFTLAAEHSGLRERMRSDSAREEDEALTALEPTSVSNTSTGLTAQASVVLRDALYVSAGVRHEDISPNVGLAQTATLPMLGAAFVRDGSVATLKLRAAYGKGVRAARSLPNFAGLSPNTRYNPFLGPEEQSGTEAGVDLLFGRRAALHLTRFDQVASGLIQTVKISDPRSGKGSGSGPGGPMGPSGGGEMHESWFELQNVGDVTNRGWESQASLALGALSFEGAATYVDSRVRKIATRYSGELRAGDRMLAVPARTLSGSVDWRGERTQLSTTVSRASDWIYYDRLKIATFALKDTAFLSNLNGAALRNFHIAYPGATRVRVAGSVDVWRNLSLAVTGDNLLNRQRGEPDTITIVPGRTITVGLRARF